MDGLSLSYAKAIGITRPEPELIDLLAVKATGKHEISGYVVLWGDEGRVDVEREYFTKATDFWDARLPMPRPLTYNHGQDESTKADPVIGSIVEMGDDDIGRWYTAQLSLNHKYRKAIDELVKAKAVGTSSDSAPQYVLRERGKSGATWLRQWPLFAAALTATPAEPRMLDTIYWKSIRLELPPDGAAPDGCGTLDSAAVDSLKRWYDLLNILR